MFRVEKKQTARINPKSAFPLPHSEIPIPTSHFHLSSSLFRIEGIAQGVAD
jgi:hypothetical protein